jgi:futalosine hydrolase
LDPILLVCSVPLERDPARRHFTKAESTLIGRRAADTGMIGSTPVILLAGGMGKTNAASAVTAVLERTPVGGVVGFGVAGAYEGSGLAPGDVALAASEHYGDEGVATPDGWMSCEGIGIPLLASGEQILFNDFPCDPARLAAVREAFPRRGRALAIGPFVTVSCCSGTAGRGGELAERFGAICETMEGAAYAHVAALYGLPFLEVRGVSNVVEDRDLSRWKLPEAVSAAADALPLLLAAGFAR